MNVGSLFSGIGGFDLGLERAGMRTVWFCEQDEFCQRVLARHWPGVPCYPDVRSLVSDAAGPRRNGSARSNAQPQRRGERTGGDDADRCGEGERAVPVPVPPVDVLCGGFPCQDLSVAGKGAGLDGSRSGLWSEYARLIGELRPRYVIVENVPALLARGFGRVLGDLAALGYDAEWDCIPASAFGAPHRRDRVWVVAYPSSEPGGLAERRGGGQGREPSDPSEPALVRQGNGAGSPEGLAACDRAGNVADAERPRLQGRTGTGESRQGRSSIVLAGGYEELGGKWLPEPNVDRVANGVPARVDRLRSLGNALLPQIAEWIGSRVMEYERQKNPVRW